jgi:ABC-type Na+ efflux pump permease subunit
MRKILALMLAVLMIVTAFALPAFAEEVTTETEVVTEAVDETVDEVVTEAPVTEEVTEYETETETEAETEPPVSFDEWLYGLIKDASPEQIEMIEEIVLGGVGALDQLGIKGFDRLRVFVEHNMATVMVILLFVALVGFIVVTILQKRGFAKKADILNSNAIEMYEAGQNAAIAAQNACNEYADRADKSCRDSARAAQEAASSAKEALRLVAEERSMLIAELRITNTHNEAMRETINYLMQCSDLSVREREEAQRIFNKGLEAIRSDEQDEA